MCSEQRQAEFAWELWKMAWRLGVSQGDDCGCIISTPQQSNDSASVNGMINHIVSGGLEEGDFFQCGEWSLGCLEDDWALSETAGAQEEMQRTGEEIG